MAGLLPERGLFAIPVMHLREQERNGDQDLDCRLRG
ncbi:hypothetical protein SAMN04488580_11615 [Mycobacterium sp. 283mftsu]|nr:hypothetical protein SAMN04488580_11615 [Mycobacterium sp. 283mftsu]